ncbi:MAG: M42 family metallopeptidase [Oscillospiraceae bacterium]|nr:M42 family metallopeptidase [Oscillospiraceae bacterium]
MDQRAQQITDGCMKRAVELLAIDSPTGYTWMAAEHVTDAYRIMGLDPEITRKGGVLVCLNPDAPEDDAVLLEAHVDTLGGMVTEITGSGRLNLTPLGGMEPNNAEGENVRVVTRSGRIYTGTFQMKNASVHVNLDYHSAKREYKSMEVVIDEEVSSREDVEKLGIQPGDIVCFDPRTRVTDSGYIKSRFLDDKLSVAILLELAARVASGEIKPSRRVWEHITVFEEVGHGGSASVPEGVTEAISVDMGCVGDGLGCDERKVSICAKDSRGPYHYEVVTALIEAARRSGADYAVDVYPAYGSDVEATLSAGHDLRHGLVGPGVYASHGYERSHRKGVCSTFLLLEAYLA